MTTGPLAARARAGRPARCGSAAEAGRTSPSSTCSRRSSRSPSWPSPPTRSTRRYTPSTTSRSSRRSARRPPPSTSARALAGDRPVVVGPVTLRPRFNPNATAPEAPRRRAQRRPRPTPGRRRRSPPPGRWVACTAWPPPARPRSTYFETAGPCGVVDASGAPYPVYEVLAAVAPSAGAELLDVTLRDPLAVEALALRRGTESPRRPGEPHPAAAGVRRGVASGPVPLPRARALRHRPDRRSLRRRLKKGAAARTPRSPPRSPAPPAARRYPPPRRPGPPAPPGRRPGRRRAPWRSTAPARAGAPGRRARR